VSYFGIALGTLWTIDYTSGLLAIVRRRFLYIGP
jgi:hypothetical protein